MLTRMHPEKKASDQDLWSEASPCVKSDTCLINGEMKCQISLCVGVCVCVFLSPSAPTAACTQDRQTKGQRICRQMTFRVREWKESASVK